MRKKKSHKFANSPIHILAAVIAILCASPKLQAQQRGRSSCDVCHSEVEFLRQRTDSTTRAQQVHVTDAMIARSAHAKLTCTSCHDGFGSFPHKAGGTKTCASCHAQERDAWTKGAHALESGKAGAQCIQCHGIHEVLSADSLHKTTGMAVMNRNCTSCHQSAKLNPKSPHAGKVLCASCHGAHDTQPAHNRESRLWANQQLQTCGTCHETIAAAWSSKDVHARALLTRQAQDGKGILRRAPACTDCHGAHGMVVTGDSTLAKAGSERCSECHTRTAGHYEDSYHGQAEKLGSKKVAVCADCHTAHTIQRPDQPTSSVAKANLTKTCGRCHKTATAGFTSFDPHVDAHDRKNPLVFWTYRLMSLLLLGTLSFFGLHTALWLIRLNMDSTHKRNGRDA